MKNRRRIENENIFRHFIVLDIPKAAVHRRTICLFLQRSRSGSQLMCYDHRLPPILDDTSTEQGRIMSEVQWIAKCTEISATSLLPGELNSTLQDGIMDREASESITPSRFYVLPLWKIE